MGFALSSKASQVQPERSRAWGAVYKAVAYSPYLTRAEKAVLNYLTMHLDPRKRGRDSRWAKNAAIAAATGYSQRHVLRVTNGLHVTGYILKSMRFVKGRKAPSMFALTNRIFEEYEQALAQKRARKALSSACDIMSPSQCDIASHKSKSDHSEVIRPKNLGTTERGAEKVVTAKRRIGTRQAGRRIIFGALKWVPGDFIPYSAIDGLADSLLDRFGIRAMREMQRRLEAQGMYGLCGWRPDSFEAMLRDITNEESNSRSEEART